MHPSHHRWRLWAFSLLACSAGCQPAPPAPALANCPERGAVASAAEPKEPVGIGTRAGERFGCFTVAEGFHYAGDFSREGELREVRQRIRRDLKLAAHVLCTRRAGHTCDATVFTPGCAPSWAVPESVLAVYWDGYDTKMLFRVATPAGPVTASLSNGGGGLERVLEMQAYLGELATKRIAKWLEHSGGEVTGFEYVVSPAGSRLLHARSLGTAATPPEPAIPWRGLEVHTVDAADGSGLVSMWTRAWRGETGRNHIICLREAGAWSCTPDGALRSVGLQGAAPVRFLGRQADARFIEWRRDMLPSGADGERETLLVRLDSYAGLSAYPIARLGVDVRWREEQGDHAVEYRESIHFTPSLVGDGCLRLAWGAREHTVYLVEDDVPATRSFRSETIRALDAAVRIGGAPGLFAMPQSEGRWRPCSEGER